MIDVGQGDCTLIRYKGKNVLIDGGGSLDNDYNVGEKVLLPYLLDKKIKRLQGKKVKIYRTDEMGEIKIIVEKNGEVMVNSIKSIQKN